MHSIILPTNQGIPFAKRLSRISDISMGKRDLGLFSDGEIKCRLRSSVIGKNVYMVGSTHPPLDNLFELLILAHTAKRYGARRVIAVIPYLGYAKADKPKPKGVAVTAHLIAKLIHASGIDRLITTTFHSREVRTFFTIPVTEIDPLGFLAAKMKHGFEVSKPNVARLIVIAPDRGALTRARHLSRLMGISKVITLKKSHPELGKTVTSFKGSMRDSDSAIIVDDFTLTGATVLNAVSLLKNHGIKNFIIVLNHVVPTGPAVKNLMNERSIRHIFTTNSIPQKPLQKFTIVDIAHLIAGAL